MKIRRACAITGKVNNMDLDITEDQYNRLNKGLELIQDIVPDLTPDEREFIMTGIMPETWQDIFGENE